ncbi:MAG: MlaD family protein [Myxococcota bacterium]|nr:MCE family protein [Deltaproteobacteria bacterium]MDQ3333796.1 MlaD family protein [Myxococcota bacterium]
MRLSRIITVVIVLALVAGAALLIYSKVPDAKVGGTFKTFALFHDGSRLQPGSPVIIAGVRVGDVTELSIEGRLARVDMALQSYVRLPAETTFVTRRSDSLFGDSYVEIIPGVDEPGVRMLKSGEQLTHVQEGGSTDRVLRSIARALPKIDIRLERLHEIVVDARPFVQGAVRERILAADTWLQEGHIEAPLTKADRALERIEGGTSAVADVVATTGKDVPDRLARWNKNITDARKGMVNAQARIVTTLTDARKGMDRIDEPVAKYTEVLGAINEARGDDWRGTLGTLVNEPQLADDIEGVTEGLKGATAGFDRFKAWLGGRIEANYYSGAFRVYATAEVHARSDKFYLVEIERSGLGPHGDQLTDSPNSDPYTRREIIHDQQRFTFQFGKRLGWFQVRGGIKDSTVGVGADFLFMQNRLKFSADVFGAYYRTPRVKLAAAIAVWRNLYILGGVDDALNPHDELPVVTGNTPVPGFFQTVHYGRDFFMGASLQFSDEDITTMLRLYGALLIGLL